MMRAAVLIALPLVVSAVPSGEFVTREHDFRIFSMTDRPGSSLGFDVAEPEGAEEQPLYVPFNEEILDRIKDLFPSDTWNLEGASLLSDP